MEQLLDLGWLDIVDLQAHAEFESGMGAGGASWAMSAVIAVDIGDQHDPLTLRVAGSHGRSGWSFDGSLAPPSDLTLRTIVADLVGPSLLPQVPDLIGDLAVVEVTVSHDSSPSRTAVGCRVAVPADHDRDGLSRLRIIEANLDVVHTDTTTVSGGVTFEFSFATSGTLDAHFVHDEDGLRLSAHLELDATLADLITEVIDVDHLPDWLRDLRVTSLDLDLDPTSGEFALACTVDWDAPGHQHTADTEAVFSIVHVPKDGDRPAESRVDARLSLHGTVFECRFAPGTAQPALFELVASESADGISLGNLIRAVGLTPGESLDKEFDLVDAALVLDGPATGRRRLFLVDLGIDLDLSSLGDLPLVGEGLRKADRLELSFHAYAASDNWTKDDLESIGEALNTDGSRVIAVPTEIPEATSHLDVSLRIGDGDAIPLTSPPASQPAPQGGASTAGGGTPVPVKPAGAVEWHQLGRSFGPVHVEAIGVGVAAADEEITVLLAGSVTFGGLTVSLLGFGGKYTMQEKVFTPRLDGLGLDVRRDPLEIAGAFVEVDGEFRGGLLVRTEQFTIHVFGAFKMIDGQPSMFAYGILDKPLGGPGFFFVEQLAAGFGYNRTIILPDVAGVRQFPLVAAAIATPAAEADSDDIIPGGLEAFQPQIGSYFFAVGVKASTYQLLDTVLVLALMVGPRTRIALLGSSTFETPPNPGPAMPIARVELDLIGEVDIDAGTVLLRGAIDPASYVFHPHCHLGGEFAFATWFQGKGPAGDFPHAGDFVLTVGGYHPRFKAPGHYPTARRITLHYPITRELTVSGSGYFALTPSAFMAGAAISARYDDGSIRASFSAGLDFLLQWKPFHYDISVAVTISASWWIFDADVHADVHIWGPEFAGVAHVKWSAISFTIEFGANSRASSAPISWTDFRTSFLPAADTIGLRVVKGAVSQYTDPDVGVVWVVDRTHLEIESDSHIPCSDDGVPIRPMGRVAGGSTTPTYTFGDLELMRDSNGAVVGVGSPTGELTDEFGPLDTVAKNFPAALWGTPIARPDDALRSDAMVSHEAGRRFGLRQPTRAQGEEVGRIPEWLPPDAVTVAATRRAAHFAPKQGQGTTTLDPSVRVHDDRSWQPGDIARHVVVSVTP